MNSSVILQANVLQINFHLISSSTCQPLLLSCSDHKKSTKLTCPLTLQNPVWQIWTRVSTQWEKAEPGSCVHKPTNISNTCTSTMQRLNASKTREKLVSMQSFSLLPSFPRALASSKSNAKDAWLFYFIFSPMPPFVSFLQDIIPSGVCAVSPSYGIRDHTAQRLKSLPCPTRTNKTINNSPSSGRII